MQTWTAAITERAFGRTCGFTVSELMDMRKEFPFPSFYTPTLLVLSEGWASADMDAYYRGRVDYATSSNTGLTVPEPERRGSVSALPPNGRGKQAPDGRRASTVPGL